MKNCKGCKLSVIPSWTWCNECSARLKKGLAPNASYEERKALRLIRSRKYALEYRIANKAKAMEQQKAWRIANPSKSKKRTYSLRSRSYCKTK